MNSKKKLRKAGLRATKQRIVVADILFNGQHRHFTAEDLQSEILKIGKNMSLATIYNCLKSFRDLGIIKQVESLSESAVFDTNVEYHHHFMNEETGELIDIKPSEINLSKLPKIPEGYSQSGLDVIIKLRKNS